MDPDKNSGYIDVPKPLYDLIRQSVEFSNFLVIKALPKYSFEGDVIGYKLLIECDILYPNLEEIEYINLDEFYFYIEMSEEDPEPIVMLGIKS